MKSQVRGLRSRIRSGRGKILIGLCILLLIGLWIRVLFVHTAPTPEVQGFNIVEYLCCDWGPAMRLSVTTNDPPQFSTTEEDVYFLKQMTFRGKGDNGTSIYLCKMTPDGTEKFEIKRIFHNVVYPIDTQDQTTWLDVNEKTRQIALSITYAGTDLIGLWTMGLDGGALRKILPAADVDPVTQRINKPSWTPDGQWIVFEENGRRILMSDKTGKQIKEILVGKGNEAYREPCVSPDGKRIAVSRYPNGWPGQRWIWLADIDGANLRPLITPKSQRFEETTKGWGSWPAWSPDGKRILYTGMAEGVAEVESEKVLWLALTGQGFWGWPHWGKAGVVGYAVRGLLVTDSEMKESKLVGPSRRVECLKSHPEDCRW